MSLISLGRNVAFLLRHAFHQKFTARRAARTWRAKREPFVHKGARASRFRLYPGQYIDEEIYRDGIYERRFLEFLSRRMRPGGVMLDVGANIGNHAIYLRNDFDAVHCFEPNPTTVARLNENVRLNDARNVHVHAIGFGSRRARLPFQEIADNLSVSRFAPAGDTGSVTLPIIPGDEWVEENAVHDLRYVKIDVEGFEGEVLAGLQRTIARSQPLITAEFSGHSPDQEETGRALTGLDGYELYEPKLEPGNVGTRQKVGFYLANAVNTPLVRVATLEPRYYPYLLAIPTARREEFGIS